MDRDDILAFARRDWGLVAESKTQYWLDRKRRLSPAQILVLGGQLRQYVQSIRPDWPAEADRTADLAVHERVTEALRAVHAKPR